MTKCGSPVYMSPELCAGKPYDRGCDVWALGCVLYEMMSLSAPWVDQLPHRHGMLTLMRLICSGSLNLATLRKHYSEDLCALLAALLCKQPQQRPSFRRLLQLPLIRRTLAKLNPEQSLPATPPLTPPTSPPLSPVVEPDDATATGDAPPAASPPSPPLPTYVAPPPRPLNAAAAAAKHVNIFEELTRPGGYGAPASNPFNARGPLAKAQVARAHGADVHAAAMAVQRSFHAHRRRAQQQAHVPLRAAGMPSRPPVRPPWAAVR